MRGVYSKVLGIPGVFPPPPGPVLRRPLWASLCRPLLWPLNPFLGGFQTRAGNARPGRRGNRQLGDQGAAGRDPSSFVFAGLRNSVWVITTTKRPTEYCRIATTKRDWIMDRSSTTKGGPICSERLRRIFHICCLELHCNERGKYGAVSGRPSCIRQVVGSGILTCEF